MRLNIFEIFVLLKHGQTMLCHLDNEGKQGATRSPISQQRWSFRNACGGPIKGFVAMSYAQAVVHAQAKAFAKVMKVLLLTRNDNSNSDSIFINFPDCLVRAVT